MRASRRIEVTSVVDQVYVAVGERILTGEPGWRSSLALPAWPSGCATRRRRPGCGR
jgi:hypothetical protein